MRKPLVVLGSVPIALIVMVAVLLPFKQIAVYMDRSTGHLTGQLSYFGVPAGPFEMYNLKPDLLHDNTGRPSRKILVQRINFRTPWSHAYPISYPDFEYVTAFRVLFTALDDETLDQVLAERIEVWNSSALDANLHSLIAYYQQENERLRALRGKWRIPSS